MQPKYLRHKGNGRIFGYTPILAQRPDMEPYEGELPTPQAPEPVLDMETITGLDINETDPNKILLILDAIDRLDPTDGFTKTGIPDTRELSKILGTVVTAEERDEAWDIKNTMDEGYRR